MREYVHSLLTASKQAHRDHNETGTSSKHGHTSRRSTRLSSLRCCAISSTRRGTSASIAGTGGCSTRNSCGRRCGIASRTSSRRRGTASRVSRRRCRHDGLGRDGLCGVVTVIIGVVIGAGSSKGTRDQALRDRRSDRASSHGRGDGGPGGSCCWVVRSCREAAGGHDVVDVCPPSASIDWQHLSSIPLSLSSSGSGF